jgi:uncharacterized protein YndB with AHSA1/START domain
MNVKSGSLSATRIIKAPRPRVFTAWTTPELLKKWWGPGPVSCPEAHVDLRVGGEYRIANLELDGSITWISGIFESIAPPAQLVYSWNVSILPGDATLVTVDFREHPLGTELVITHDRFTEPAVRDMHLLGWGGCLDKLEALLA